MTLVCMVAGLVLMWAADWRYRIAWLWWFGLAGFVLGLIGTVVLMIADLILSAPSEMQREHE